MLARERDAGVPEYLPEPPDDATPALAYALAHEGTDSTDTVLATLLDLVDRGYYETSQATTEEEKLDLALEQKADRPAGELTGYEQDVLAFFDQLLDGKTGGDERDEGSDPQALRGLARALGADDGEARRGRGGPAGLGSQPQLGALAHRRRRRAGVRARDPAGDVGERELVPRRRRSPSSPCSESWPLPATRFKRVSAEYIQRTAGWRAFAHWTQDFPRLSDDPPATLELWKRILVYGVAFGTAERMIASGRIPAPVVTDATAGTHWSSYAFVGGFNSSSFDGASFSSGFSSPGRPGELLDRRRRRLLRRWRRRLLRRRWRRVLVARGRYLNLTS